MQPRCKHTAVSIIPHGQMTAAACLDGSRVCDLVKVLLFACVAEVKKFLFFFIYIAWPLLKRADHTELSLIRNTLIGKHMQLLC